MRFLLCLFLVGCTGTSDADKDATPGSDETGDTDTDLGTGDGDTEPLGQVPYDGADAGFRSVLTDDGDEFICEYVEENCLTDCEGNTAPVLGDSVMIVNGHPSATVKIGDHVVVRADYVDAECNVACGFYVQTLTGPEFQIGDGGSLCTNIPCKGEAGFVIGVVEAGDYSWNIRYNDSCGEESNIVTGGFSL